MTRIIEVGDSLGYDVRGYRKSLKKMIDDGDYFMINIYGPKGSYAQATLWNCIDDFMRHNNGAFVLFGDLNEVRFEFERTGSVFSQDKANTFNTFFTNNGLIELPMGSRLFTWMNKAGKKLSKLDRFLFLDNAIEALSDAQVIALDRLWSDHNPILFHCTKSDYGPNPFKLYHSWFNRDGFDELISFEWNSFGQHDNSKRLLSHKKLKGLKDKIKVWLRDTKDTKRRHKEEVLIALKNLEIKIDSNTASSKIVSLAPRFSTKLTRLTNLKH
nr:RNA-directed DNA polymerase, eukaryota, reverse transcriptase zinc-binding domain protein [Tanacetum cinerariifolium]